MTTISWWWDFREPDTQIVDVGGFARFRVNAWEFDREARRRFPILAAMPRLAHERLAEAWADERIAPLVWLSMPVHEEAAT